MITFFKKTINYHYDNKNVENLDKLIYKIYDNDIDAVKNIIENQANILNLQDNNGKTALIYAIIYKNKELVELILSKNPNVNIRDNSEGTALIYAIQIENKELVELILSKNPNVNIRDNSERTAFDYASYSYNKEIRKLFNEDSEIYKANQAFQNLINKIYYDYDINAVKNIIENQANILNIQDRDGWTALIHAIQIENKELVELILSNNPDVNIRDNYGETALMLAIRSENKELVELILSKNPDVNIMDSDGYTAFDCANIYGINLQELINKVKSSKGN